MTFLVSFHDSLFRTDAPIFVFSKKIEDDSLLLIPDHEHLMNYSTLDAQIDEGIVLYPWKNKKKLAFWRGGTSGGVFTSEKWMGYPRSKLVLLSKTHPHLLDAKFSSLVLGAENLKEVFLKQNLLSDLVSAKQHLAYRYLIDIDGNASTYSRFYWILRSNSTPMKQQSHFKQWYYPLLVPYVHFIPFKEDLSDLLEQIQWGLNHERESQEIAEKSKQFAIDYLSEISTFTYLYAMLLKYQQLCN